MNNFVLREGGRIVAEGVQFSDGTVVMRWLLVNAYSPIKPTTVVHSDIDSVVALHLHDDRRSLKWIWKEETG